MSSTIFPFFAFYVFRVTLQPIPQGGLTPGRRASGKVAALSAARRREGGTVPFPARGREFRFPDRLGHTERELRGNLEIFTKKARVFWRVKQDYPLLFRKKCDIISPS
ncbi:MAG: hypothetical protein II405_00845, partial [Oscillospiraceae bacterium]|nr:hypothetical protein [Oscillospiraceae bacterium]